ncbi:MAG: DUF4129 domain-containing protein [Kordia sp.]|uniref:DUF4129 domain-containing protein n=1 Tax=Kordia sp. TaxID=1965332 RepID=UPI00385BEBEC
MPKTLKHIFFIFSIAGMFSSALWATNTVTVDPSPVQQTPVKEDTSYKDPKQFDDDFKERYSDSDYAYDSEATEKNWIARIIDWIETTVQDWFNLDTQEQASDVVKDIINIFYVLIVILVVFFIARALMDGEGRWVFGKQSNRRMINYEDVETDIHVTDFDQLIEESITKTDYRLAIRYQYLNMLKQLSAAEIIAFDPEKTNFDYTYEITDDAVREQFQYTSYLYDYVWYGEFDIDKSQYEQAKESFRVLLKNVAA